MLKGQFIMRIIHEFDEDEVELAHKHLHAEDYYNALYDINVYLKSSFNITDIKDKISKVIKFYNIDLED